jgi:hypothetical protein
MTFDLGNIWMHRASHLLGLRAGLSPRTALGRIQEVGRILS